MMVTYSLSSLTSFSIFEDAIGSKDDVGSSISSTSGCIARALAMHSRCCCPPDKLMPGLLSSFLTSSHKAASLRDYSTTSEISFLSLIPFNFKPAATLLNMVIVGNGLGFWKTIPTRRLTMTGSIDLS